MEYLSICLCCLWFLSFSSVQFSHSVVLNSFRPHELQHTRPPCPSPTPRVYSDLCPLSLWCHPTYHPLSSPSPPAFNLSRHQSLFQWVSSLHEVAKVLEFQLSLLSLSCEFVISSVQSLSRVWLCDLMGCSMPGLPVYHQFSEFIQTHVHWVSDAIQPSHPLSFPSPPAFNLSRHQGLLQWVSSSHQVTKVL